MGRHLKLCQRRRTDEFVKQRASNIRDALHDAGAGPGAELPAVLIENSSRCDTNAAGQQVLPNEEAWLPALMTSVRLEPQPYSQPQHEPKPKPCLHPKLYEGRWSKLRAVNPSTVVRYLAARP